MLLWISVALAASLDNLEVGGVWGTPLAENPTAIWWNPAGLGRAKGTQILIEGAPTVGAVSFDRVDPYNGGRDSYRLVGVIPFAGVSTDFGVEGLGFGASMSVPYARGGKADNPDGPGQFHIRDANIQALQISAAAAYAPKGLPLSFGASVNVLRSQWTANLDAELTTSLDASIREAGKESGYTDAQIENPDYAVRTSFGALSDWAVTFGAGARLDLDPVRVSVAYQHGARVDNTGDVALTFGCPPQEDTTGRYGAEVLGLCYSELDAHGSVGYNLPARLQGAVAFVPNDDLVVQAMGGWVGWSSFQDFDIAITDVEDLNTLENPETAGKVNLQRQWARDNQDTFWVGVDAKGWVKEKFIVGGRVVYDHHAVPEVAMSPNNVDTDALAITPSFVFEPDPRFRLGFSYGHTVFFRRVVDENGFGVTLDEANRKEDRYFYPQMNGTYAGGLDRLGVTLSGRFGQPDGRRAPL